MSERSEDSDVSADTARNVQTSDRRATLIYRTRSQTAMRGVVQALYAAGISPIINGDRDLHRGIVWQKDSSGAAENWSGSDTALWVNFFEVAVPDRELDLARDVIVQWEKSQMRDLSHLTRSVRRTFIHLAVWAVVFVVATKLAFPKHAFTVVSLVGTIVFSWLLVASGRRLDARAERINRGLCRHCGYNLAGNISGICPECGRKIKQHVPEATEAFTLDADE